MSEQRLVDIKHLYDNADKNNGFLRMHVSQIDDLPTIEPVRGEWEGYTTGAYIGSDEFGEPKFADRRFYRCSKCRNGTAIKSNFCPNCGADMRGAP